MRTLAHIISGRTVAVLGAASFVCAALGVALALSPVETARAGQIQVGAVAAPAPVNGCRTFRERTIHADGRVEVVLFKACE